MSLAAGDNQIILERVWAGAEWFSDLVKVVATLTADGQLGIVLLGRLQDNIGFGVDLKAGGSEGSHQTESHVLRQPGAVLLLSAAFKVNYCIMSNCHFSLLVSCRHCDSQVCRGRLSFHCSACYLWCFVYIIMQLMVHKGVNLYKSM